MTDARVDLWWLPVGAGGHVARHTSRWWELLQARREQRPASRLFHAALEVDDGEARHVVEMTPAWGSGTQPRGVVATGPVGVRMLARSRFFRYEVRCWKDGVIADREWAAAPPTRFALTTAEARALLARVPHVPRGVWGRDELGAGQMWNSNSLASWLLCEAGVDASGIAPPDGGRAPGWHSGVAASRELGGSAASPGAPERAAAA